MKRRDFLLLRPEGGEQTAELSCEKLFMHFQDISAGFQRGREEAGTAHDADWWAGEPPLQLHGVDPEQFFRNILADLDGIKTLRVRDMEWLAGGLARGLDRGLTQEEFRTRMETLLTGFRAGGGEVIYGAARQDSANAIA